MDFMKAFTGMFSHELSLDLPLELSLERLGNYLELSLQLPKKLSFMRVSIGISISLHVSGYLYSVPPTIYYFSSRCPYVCLRRDVNPYVALAFSYVVT